MAKKKKTGADAPSEKNETFKVHETDNYNTIFLGKEPDQKIKKEKQRGNALANLIDLICNPSQKEFKHETLKELKNKKGEDLLMQAILQTTDEKKLALLCSACWEADLDLSVYLKDLVKLAVERDYLVALEILTVIEDMQGPFNNDELHASVKVFETEIKKDRSAEKNELYADMAHALRNKAD